MSKVRITSDQADLIEQFKRNFKGFGREILFEALDGHYEIKERFKVGGYVMDNNSNSGIITKVVGDIAKVSVWVSVGEGDFEESFLNVYIDQLRFLEGKEIEAIKEVRFWRSNNRDVWELKKGDILIYKHSLEIQEVISINNEHDVLLSGLGVSLTKHHIEFFYKVAYFAEDRRDL